MPDLNCPHCQGEIHIGNVASLADESRVAFALAPAAGELLSAENVGLALSQAAKLMKSLDKGRGSKSEVLVERIETTPEGEMRFYLMVVRFDVAEARRKRKAESVSPEGGETP